MSQNNRVWNWKKPQKSYVILSIKDKVCLNPASASGFLKAHNLAEQASFEGEGLQQPRSA